MHLWDEGFHYNIDIVSDDVKKTIERFLHYVPDYKYCCRGNGKLYTLKEGLVNNGGFFSKEYWGDKDWFKELEVAELAIDMNTIKK